MVETTENNCSFSGELVSYLYGEQAATDRDSFEIHLAECGSCTDEFAELSFARYSVFEWNKEEFVAMETPTFVIPYERATVGWFAGMQEAFSFNWLAPAAVAATLLFVFGVAFFGLNSETQDQPLIASSPPLIVDSLPAPQSEIVVTPEVTKVEATTTVAKKTREIPTVKTKLQGISRPEITTARSVEAIQKPTRSTVLPEMTAEVEDDDSLRLADLFDTLDSK